jgi:hypothetical protein
MNEHNLFYYPYASFTDAQLPLLKVAALYFDKLYILDPERASWKGIGVNRNAQQAVKLLEDNQILETIRPEDVLAKYADSINDAIRWDMQDREFLNICDSQTRGRWTLSLAKVPQNLRTDQKMRYLMGDFARDVSKEAGRYGERAGEYRDYAEHGRAYDEYREGYGGNIEYRYADFPLALGEAIMMNHALFAGLLYANATPITDDPFHSQALSLKMSRAFRNPSVRQMFSDPMKKQKTKADIIAAATLTDRQLDLPVLDPKLPLEDVLRFRQKHDAELQQVREKLGWIARRIEADPWSKEFIGTLDTKTIPDIADQLAEVRKARDEWLGKSGRRALKATGPLAGAAAAVLTAVITPLTPVAMAIAGLGLVSGAAIPTADYLLDLRAGKRDAQENGLHYLLQL